MRRFGRRGRRKFESTRLGDDAQGTAVADPLTGPDYELITTIERAQKPISRTRPQHLSGVPSPPPFEPDLNLITTIERAQRPRTRGSSSQH